jgi:hypothetical protein
VKEGTTHTNDWVFIAWGSKDSSVEARCFGVSKVELKRRGDRHSGTPFQLQVARRPWELRQGVCQACVGRQVAESFWIGKVRARCSGA